MSTKKTALGLIPEEWEVCPIGDFTKLAQYGLSVRGAATGRYPILRMNCQVDGEVSLENLQYVDLDEETFETFRLVRGDILFNRTNSYELVGRCALFDHDVPAVFASYLIRLSVDRSRVDPAFLNYLLNWDIAQSEIKKLASRGVSQANISASSLREFCVHFPDRAEQNRIAAVLGRMRSAINLERAAEARSAALKQAAMRELFTAGLRGEETRQSEIGPVPKSWAIVEFAAVRTWLQYGTSVRCSVDQAEYPVLRIPNIDAGRVDAADLKYCNMARAEAENYLLEEGDLLFIRTNGVLERLGSCAVYAGTPREALFASYLIRARLKHDLVDPSFVAFFFGSARGTSLVAGRATPAADGKYNLNTGTIDSLPLPLPPTVDEQRDIVKILQAIDQKTYLHRRKQVVLEELFRTLLHRLMTAEARVSDLNLSALDAPLPQEATT